MEIMSDQRIEYGFPYKPPHSQKAHVRQALKEWYVEKMEQYPLVLEKPPANASLVKDFHERRRAMFETMAISFQVRFFSTSDKYVKVSYISLK